MPNKPTPARVNKSVKEDRGRAPKTSQIARTTQTVMDTVVELLGEIGYRSLTVELISKRSGVAKSTIYRHWNNIAELTTDAFNSAIGEAPELADQGDVRADLVLLYTQLSKSLGRSIWGRVLPALIEASHNDPKFSGYLNKMADVRRQSARNMLERAKARGELKQEANIEWILDALSGPLYHRILINGTPTTEPGLVDWLIDNVLSSSLQKTN